MEGGNPPTREALEGANSEGKREGGGEMGVVQGEEEEVLKREISCHPMFELLKDTQLNCLKICSGDQEEEPSVVLGQVQTSTKVTSTENHHSDLDLFMEAYYTALAELTQAIQKPMQEATAFIDFMYCVLDDIASADASRGATGTPDK